MKEEAVPAPYRLAELRERDVASSGLCPGRGFRASACAVCALVPRVEQDGDLTYFLIWHAQIILRGISTTCTEVPGEKSQEMEQATRLYGFSLNNRQIRSSGAQAPRSS